jgi:hypothetical protein
MPIRSERLNKCSFVVMTHNSRSVVYTLSIFFACLVPPIVIKRQQGSFLLLSSHGDERHVYAFSSLSMLSQARQVTIFDGLGSTYSSLSSSDIDGVAPQNADIVTDEEEFLEGARRACLG